MMLDILRGTPPWVFVLFAYLVWIGAQRLRPAVRDVRRIAIAPAIFIVWGLAGLAGRSAPPSLTLAHWLVGAVLGAALGAAMKQSLQTDHARRRVLQAASAVPLLRNIAIFGAHYLLNVAAALQPAARADFLGWDIYVSGFSAGFFIGWSIRFALAYRGAPQTDLDCPLVPAAPSRG